MKRHHTSLIIFLLILLTIVGLPSDMSQGMQYRLAASISTFWKPFHRKGKALDPAKKKEATDFLYCAAEKKEEAKKQAQEVLQDLFVKKALTGKVLFRTPQSYNSTLWIDIGSDDNPDGSLIIQKNSPVLHGDIVIGVVEYVDKKTSLVRLITDSSLTVAVRVARGDQSEHNLVSACDDVSGAIKEERVNCLSEKEKEVLQLLLEKMKNETAEKTPSNYLAKGELHGTGEPLWKVKSHRLIGVGFNYDFQDRYGESRDLRTGQIHDRDHEHATSKNTPLIQVDDILVTSGLDGIFPEGLKVAQVLQIEPLQEGASSYEIQAEPLAKDLFDLENVIVLAPQEKIPEEIPTAAEQAISEE